MTPAALRPFTIVCTLLCGMFAAVQPAAANQLSPWLGSVDQAAFQLDPVTMVAVTFAADPLYTGTIKAPLCPATGCENVPNSATTGRMTSGLPKK